jgi:hypothetical protein
VAVAFALARVRVRVTIIARSIAARGAPDQRDRNFPGSDRVWNAVAVPLRVFPARIF